MFAFGKNRVKTPEEGCILCPSLRADKTYRNDDGILLPEGPADKYDTILEKEHDSFTGIIPEEKAREVWMKALWWEAFEVAYGEHPTPIDERYLDGVEVAKALGWL